MANSSASLTDKALTSSIADFRFFLTEFSGFFSGFAFLFFGLQLKNYLTHKKKNAKKTYVLISTSSSDFLFLTKSS